MSGFASLESSTYYYYSLLLSNKVQTPSAQTIQIQRETSRLLSPYSWWWQWCVYWMLAAEVAAAALSTTLSHVHWTSIHFTLEKETKLEFWKMMCRLVSFTLKKQVVSFFLLIRWIGPQTSYLTNCNCYAFYYK